MLNGIECEWADDQADTGLSHVGYHRGRPCPYDVVTMVVGGYPDPRRDVVQWEIDLPYEKPPLSLNGRYHFMAKANLVERLQAATVQGVVAADVPHLEHVHVELHYRGRTNAVKDADNPVATLKPCIDALKKAGVVDDDTAAYVSWSSPYLHRAVRGMPGALWLVLRAYQGAAA